MTKDDGFLGLEPVARQFSSWTFRNATYSPTNSQIVPSTTTPLLASWSSRLVHSTQLRDVQNASTSSPRPHPRNVSSVNLVLRGIMWHRGDLRVHVSYAYSWQTTGSKGLRFDEPGRTPRSIEPHTPSLNK